MAPRSFCLLLLTVVACASAQSEDELHIPVENDNRFPPDHVDDGTIIDGSGAGAIEEPSEVLTTTEARLPPILEDVQTMTDENELPIAKTEDSSCPKPCVCHIEGNSDNFVVDCSGYDITEFPSPIDVKTTTLNLQNNQLTEVPKDVSALKNLQVLNVDNNRIMDLAAGSISELPELTVLKLGNNRLIEYPQDLKNGFGLTKLKELDLGGNDMRTSFNHEIFSHFTTLQKLTLPTSTPELVQDLCNSLKESLETVCTESCSKQTYECPEAPQNFGDEMMDVILPGTIALGTAIVEADPSVSKDDVIKTAKEDLETSETQTDIELNNVTPEAPEEKAEDEFSLRSAVNEAPAGIAPLGTVVEAPRETPTNDEKEAEVAVGATTTGTKTGGVDKSVIGMIVAGMVLVVAGVTIKKNWSAIRNKFSSTPRAANERAGANANGTTPEEVPLQEKSPV